MGTYRVFVIHAIISTYLYCMLSVLKHTYTGPYQGQTSHCLDNQRTHLQAVLAHSYTDVPRCVLCVAELPTACNTTPLTLQQHTAQMIYRMTVSYQTIFHSFVREESMSALDMCVMTNCMC